MSEKIIPKIEKSDVAAPVLEAEETAIVLQRHERYERGREIEAAGSIFDEDAEVARKRAMTFFENLLEQEKTDGIPTKVLFVSSDTRYAGKGFRSLETGQLAQDAAQEVFEKSGVDSSKRIINLNPHGIKIERHDPTDQEIYPLTTLVEPKIFDDNPEFVKELGRKYNPPELQDDIDARRTDVQLSPQAFGAYEADEPEVKELRAKHGAEGVHDILERTKFSLETFQAVAEYFHEHNPGERLVIWATSHYDTISPLVKDSLDIGFDEYVPVDYGAGVVITIPAESKEMRLKTRDIDAPVKKLADHVVEKYLENLPD